jgi:hypothetical protein
MRIAPDTWVRPATSAASDFTAAPYAASRASMVAFAETSDFAVAWAGGAGRGTACSSATLPFYCSTYWWNGVPYYYADDDSYVWNNSYGRIPGS